MRIAIDGKRYYPNSSGLGRYSSSLVDHLPGLDDAKELDIGLHRLKGKIKCQPKIHQRPID